MKNAFRFSSCLLILILFTKTASGQNSLSLSTQGVYSKVAVSNNWSPPTAVNRKHEFEGTARGFGATLNYRFQPSFLSSIPGVRLVVGAGYFKQQFNLERPFNYTSPFEPIFYTDNYSYHCWQWSGGLMYIYPLTDKYSLNGNLSYHWLKSFRQEYEPSYGMGENPAQTNYKQLDFGNMANLEIGLNRNLGSRFSIGLHVVVPLYTRWRNDVIFKDDPSAFSHPKLSLGSSISIAYNFKKI